MELRLTRGCVCNSLTVDDEEEINLTDEEKQEVINKVMKHLKPEDCNYLLQWFIETFGDYDRTDKPCDCCGDYVEWWKIEI